MSAIERSDPAITWLRDRRFLAREGVKNETRRLLEKGKPWPVYDKDLRSYDYWFDELFPNSSLSKVLADRKSGTGRLSVLHAFGGTGTLRSIKQEIGLEYGLAITLVDFRSAEIVRTDQDLNIWMVDGDAYRHTTWGVVRGEVARNIPSGFDFVLSAPMGGWGGLGHDTLMHTMILNRLWSMLNNDGGVMCIAFDSYDSPTEGDFWNRFFLEKGLDAFGVGSLLKLTRHPGDPEKLPRPKRADLVM